MAIRWTQSAATDLQRICDYIAADRNNTVARNVAFRIHETIDGLDRFPYAGRLGRKPGTREIVAAGLPYVIIYRVRAEVVEVSRILHGAQKRP